MATFKVVGRGEKNKFFDENSYRSAVGYILDPQKAEYAGGCNVSSLKYATPMKKPGSSSGRWWIRWCSS